MLRNIRLLREEYGISQQKLADGVGVSQQSINKYENHNIEPDISTLIQIADFFETSIDYICGHTDIRRKIEETTELALNESEADLVKGYRALAASSRKVIDSLVGELRKAHSNDR